MKLIVTGATVVLASLSLSFAVPHEAEACGGCFVQPSANTVVSGHRMVMSISSEQTVLWDQIQYQGEPEDFAWVLPVKPGARVEEATDAFFETLEAATVTTVAAQPVSCGSGSSGDDDGCSFGCGDDAAEDGGGDSLQPEPDPVEVVHQGSVGPYESVTLSTSTPGALNTWLTEHGYAVDPASQPVIDQYVTEGFDFIALRLQPGQGVKQMKPVRIVSPGAGLSLPLRMVAIGTGAQTPIVLHLIGEGRYTIDNLSEVKLDAAALTWDFGTATSNYESLRLAALGQNGGKSFLTTFSGSEFMTGKRYVPDGRGGSDTFAASYAKRAMDNGEAELGCTIPAFISQAVVQNPCPAGEPLDSPLCQELEPTELDARTFGCDGAYDIAMALIGMRPSSVVVTRLEMNLPRDAFAADLALGAGLQVEISNQLVAAKNLNEEQACALLGAVVTKWERPRGPNKPLRFAPFAITSIGVLLLLRRLVRARLRPAAAR